MSLKVEDALKLLSRTDPDSEACRDLIANIRGKKSNNYRKYYKKKINNN